MNPPLPLLSRATCALVFFWGALGAAPRSAEALATVTVARTGGGWLVADGRSRVPLTVIVDGDGPHLSGVRAQAGGIPVEGPVRLDARRYRFVLSMPGEERVEELRIELSFVDGTVRTETYPLVVGPSRPKPLDLTLEPSRLNIEFLPQTVTLGSGPLPSGAEVEIHAAGADVEPLHLHPTEIRASLQVPAEFPPHAPSHVQVLAVARFSEGFGAETLGLSIVAPVTLRAPVPRGWRMVVKGAEPSSEPMTPASRGPDGVAGLELRLRYGAPVRIFRVRQGRRRELSIPIPTGRVSAGVVAALPGQGFADGGTGPTLAVAVPPDPFGGAPVWPEIAVTGARLVDTVAIGPSVRVLVLERPTQAGLVEVELDGLPAGRIQLSSSFGEQLRLEPAPPREGERAAAVVEVRDGQGALTSRPRPAVRIDGTKTRLEAVDEGRWRVAVPAREAEPGASADIRAELPPLPVAFGEPRTAPRIRTSLSLDPWRPAVSVGRRSSRRGSGTAWSLGARVFGGSTFGSALRGGFGVELAVTLPPLEERFGLRSGLELGLAQRDGTFQFGAPDGVPGSTTIGGLILPLELTFAVVDVEALTLSARAGASLRYEEAQLEVDGESAGGAARWSGSARFGVEGLIPLGPGQLMIGALFDGVFADASGLAASPNELTGDLAGLRGEIGWRAWLDL
ncbi:MAG: hypothetical protein AAFZ18_12695 [Myxococcota bacterium]